MYNYGKTKNFKKISKRRSVNDHGEFQQQSPQRLDDGYRHTSGRNDRRLTDAVEIDPKEILFYWKSKKLE